MPAPQITRALESMSRYPVPQPVLADVHDLCARYGRLRLVADDDGSLSVLADDDALLAEVSRAPDVAALLAGRDGPRRARVSAAARGALKQALVMLGWPVRDEAPYVDGAR